MKRIALDALPLQVRSAGIGVYTAELTVAMARQRPDVEFVLFGARGPMRAVFSRGGAERRRIWPANVRRLDSPLYPIVMGYPLVGLPRAARLESVLRDADLFHATNYAAPRSRRTPSVVTIHDLTLLRHPELGTPALRRLVGLSRRSAAEAALVIADSEATRRDAIEILGIPDDRIRVVHLGCDAAFRPMQSAEARTLLRARLGLDGPYLLHVGTVEPRKNLPRLIRAYDRLRRARGISHLLVLAGDAGWGREEVARQIAALGLGERVRWVAGAERDTLCALYAAAELAVVPSLAEGFGLPLLEAMACGTPVVASRAGSLPEVGADAPVYVDPLSEEAIAEAIARILADPPLRGAMRDRGLARATLFSWDRTARETLAVYEESIRGNRGAVA